MNFGTLNPLRTGSDWIESVAVEAPDGVPIDLNAYSATIDIQLRDINGRHFYAASSTDGTVTMGLGRIDWLIRASALGRLCPGPYVVHVRVKAGEDTEHLFSADLPVLDGGFR